MITGDVNYLAVVIAAVINLAIGAWWYSPAGFGKQWSALMGWGEGAKMEAMKKGAAKSYIWGFVTALVTAFVLANVVRAFGAVTLVQGATIGFWMWLGFAATIQIGSILWDLKPPKLFFINTLYSLVTLVINGALLAMWA